MTSKVVEGEKLDPASLGPVTELTINRIVKADMKRLEGLDQLPLKALSLRWLSAADLTEVPLPPTLERLQVWQSRKLKSVEGIARVENLRMVALRENGNPFDLSALAQLPQLNALSIEGGFNTQQKLISFDPIEGLPITKMGMQAIDGAGLDMGPIARLPKLRKLDVVPHCFAPEGLAEVAAAKPWFFDQLMVLEPAGSWVSSCKKCKGTKVTSFLKGTKLHWCPDCESATLTKHLDGFREMVRAAGGAV